MKTNQVLAVGYGRTSGEDKSDKKVSVDAQHEEFQKACAANNWKGIWTEDRGVSGRAYPTGANIADLDTVTTAYLADKNTKQRTRQGLAKALSSGASILWVRSLDRFSRPLSGSYLDSYLRAELSKHNITIWSGECGKVDFSKFETRLIATLTNETKDEDIKGKTKGSTSSRILKRDSGLLYTDPYCMGFRTAGKGKVNPIPEELATVKLIFQLYMKNPTVRHVCVTLGKQGVKPFEAKSWGRKSITNILKRPWYVGYQYNSAGTLIPSPVFKPHAITGITLLDFERIQNALSKNEWAGIKRESKFAHPLSSLLRCGCCKSLMVPYRANNNRNTPTRYYRCKNTYNDGQKVSPTCNKTLIRETYGELAYVDQQHGYLSQYSDNGLSGLIEALSPFAIAGYIRQLSETDTTPELKAKQSTLKLQLQALTDLLTTRYQDMEAGILPRESYLALSKQSKAQTDMLKSELDKVQKEISKASTSFTLHTSSIGQLEDMSHREYSALIRKLIHTVYVHSDKIEIETVDGKSISIPRMKIRNGRQLPTHIEDFGAGGKHITISYQYPADQLPKNRTLFKSDTLTILAVPLQA